MAEYVESNLESMVPELEQLQRVQLFTKGEVNQVLKRRKRFEYKLQKQNKEKADFLAYIQYEMGILSLIELRREKTGYLHKKEEIDYAVARRITKLYKILQHRFQSDVKVWLSHIDFLKRMKWNDVIGRTFRRMLQVHVTNASLWIAAAKYEIEEMGSAENARNLLQEAIRLNPKSRELFKEYFRLELMYVDQLRKREEILLGGGSDKVPALPSEETRDAVMDGGVAITVFDFAADKISGSDNDKAAFLASMLDVALDFEFARGKDHAVRKHIEKYLDDKCADNPVTWDAKARLALRNDGDNEDAASRLLNCIRLYDEGVNRFEGLDGERTMMALCIEGLMDVADSVAVTSAFPPALTTALLETLRRGDEKGLLGEQHYLDWLFLIQDDEEEETQSKVLDSALSRHPQSVGLLKLSLTRKFEEGSGQPEEIAKEFLAAAEHISSSSSNSKTKTDDIVDLWKFAYVNVLERSEKAAAIILEKAVLKHAPVAPVLRSLLLDRLYTVKGLTEARAFYDGAAYSPPFGKEFHLKMLELENSEKKVDVKRTRKIYEAATDQFKADLDVWVDFAAFEGNHGKTRDVESVKMRARAALGKDSAEAFDLGCGTRS